MNEEMRNTDIRRRAAEVLKGSMGPALLVGLIASLPNLISQIFPIFMGGSLIDRLYDLMSTATTAELQNPLVWMSWSEKIIDNRLYIIWAVSLIALLVTPVLSAGHYLFTLRLVRGKQ